MGKCCFNNDVKYFAKPNAGVAPQCNPVIENVSEVEAIATCPPIGEPKNLTLLAPVVFDESGLNLCRVVCLDELVNVCDSQSNRPTDILFDGLTKKDLAGACRLQLQVVDIDFNFLCPTSGRFSDIKPAKGTPNLSRITLKDIDVTLACKIIDGSGKVTKEGMMKVRYLPAECAPGFDPCTNPCSVTLDLYTPYGVSYAPENPDGCNKLVPTINFIGLVSNQTCECEDGKGRFYNYSANNTLQQGISAQALARVVAYTDNCFAIGLTLYIKSMYYVQYKFKHEGLTVPPKLAPVREEEVNHCLQFVEGDLMEQSIQPLSVGEDAKTTRGTQDDDRCIGSSGCSCTGHHGKGGCSCGSCDSCD